MCSDNLCSKLTLVLGWEQRVEEEMNGTSVRCMDGQLCSSGKREHVHVYPDLHVHAHVHVCMVPPMIVGVIDTSAWCYDSYLRFIMHYSAEPSAL